MILHHGCHVATIVMCTGGGHSPLSIGRMMNAPMLVASDPGRNHQ